DRVARWQIREINLVSCNSASQRSGATNIASQLAARFQALTRNLGFQVVVRGVDGFATVNRGGDVLNVPRGQYADWQRDLNKLKKDAKKDKLPAGEIRQRNQTILDTYSTGRRNDFAEYRTT
ncbi:MAG: hypothetical protein ACJ76N_29020, partial [Thermoanaerobaculia bacterium]